MSPEKEKKLFNRFKFYRPDLPLTESLMAFGFACRDGWFDLIWKLSEEIEPLVDDDFRVLQVKEKFGTLRFYVSSATDEVYDIIDKYEKMSGHTCEICGSDKGKLRSGGWLVTLCDKCYAEY